MRPPCSLFHRCHRLTLTSHAHARLHAHARRHAPARLHAQAGHLSRDGQADRGLAEAWCVERHAVLAPACLFPQSRGAHVRHAMGLQEYPGAECWPSRQRRCCSNWTVPLMHFTPGPCAFCESKCKHSASTPSIHEPRIALIAPGPCAVQAWAQPQRVQLRSRAEDADGPRGVRPAHGRVAAHFSAGERVRCRACSPAPSIHRPASKRNNSLVLFRPMCRYTAALTKAKASPASSAGSGAGADGASPSLWRGYSKLGPRGSPPQREPDNGGRANFDVRCRPDD